MKQLTLGALFYRLAALIDNGVSSSTPVVVRIQNEEGDVSVGGLFAADPETHCGDDLALVLDGSTEVEEVELELEEEPEELEIKVERHLKLVE